VNLLRFDHLCYGHWQAMVHHAPRVPDRKQAAAAASASATDSPDNDKMEDDNDGASREQLLIVTEKPDFEIDIDKDSVLR
jgi:hypothetical protein